MFIYTKLAVRYSSNRKFGARRMSKTTQIYRFDETNFRNLQLIYMYAVSNDSTFAKIPHLGNVSRMADGL